MPLDAHDASVAVFVRGLTSLKSLLMKGEAHASVGGTDPAELLRAQLAPGMYSLAVQVHWAAEGARLAVDRLVGAAVAPPAGEGEAKSFAELHQRIDATVAYLRALEPEKVEAGLGRPIEIEHRGGSMKFVGAQFLLQFAIPGFFFHYVTAYGILRHQGVQVTKGDFMGPLG
jgi:hypothetical protein